MLAYRQLIGSATIRNQNLPYGRFAVKRPFEYLQSVVRLMNCVQEIHRTTPSIAPLTNKQVTPLTNTQVHFWLQQITLEDLDAADQLGKAASAASRTASKA
jgi:hypothetical protein